MQEVIVLGGGASGMVAAISAALRSPLCHFASSASRAAVSCAGVSSRETVPELRLAYQRTTLSRGRGGQTTLQPQHMASAETVWEPSLSDVQSTTLAAL